MVLGIIQDIGTSLDESGKVVRRPQALPVWSHRYGHIDDEGFFLPKLSDPDIDAVSGATPTDGFALRSTYASTDHEFDVYLELNQSFDWNAYFPEDGLPDDLEYAGGNGQPSVVYRARVDTRVANPEFAMDLVGFGHYGGKRGAIYTDLRRITSARDILLNPIVRISM